MDAIKNVTLDPVKGQIELLTSASSVSKGQNRSNGNIKNNKKSPPDTEQVKEAMNEKINRIAEAMDSYVQSVQRDLKIQVHEGTGDIIVRVTSHDSGKVIREIPPKELLDLAARMEEMAGTIFDENV